MSLLNFLKPKIVVATHNGSFHADDVFAVATLSIWAEQNGKGLKVVRTRDPEIINKADIVVDVGMEYDPGRNRFDHHQRGGAGSHDINQTVPYASFGLIWKHFGEKISTKEIAEKIEKELVIPIDARDNGINITPSNTYGFSLHSTSNAIHNLNPTWQEDQNKIDKQFNTALYFAKDILMREIAIVNANLEGSRLTKKAIESQNNPEILVLEERIDSEEEVSKHKNIKFVASKSKDSDNWSVISARDNTEDYTSNRATFPESWRGLRDQELEKASGVEGAIFCHRGGWFVKAETKEAALKMAQKALDMV